MTELTQRALDEINKIPRYVESIYHSTDTYRVYDAAIAISQNTDSIEDAKEYLDNNLDEGFIHRDNVLKDCKTLLDIIVHFLTYTTYGNEKRKNKK